MNRFNPMTAQDCRTSVSALIGYVWLYSAVVNSHQFPIQVRIWRLPWVWHFNNLHIGKMCGLVMDRLERWTCNSTVAGSTPQPFRFRVTTLGRLFAHMCLCHHILVLVKGRWCPAAGNVTVMYRSGVALAIYVTDFDGSSSWRAHGLSKGDEHPAYIHASWSMAHLNRCWLPDHCRRSLFLL